MTVALLFSLWTTAGLADARQAAPEQGPRITGVVVEEVREGSVLAKAGLLPDDLLLAWERLPNPPANPEGVQGELRSPFDWEWIQVEQAPRGIVRLRGERQEKPKIWTVEPGLWEAEVRPAMPAAVLGGYLRGQELVAARDFESGAALWKKLAGRAEVEALRCWLYLQVGDVWFENLAWEKAHAAYRSAQEMAQEPMAQVFVWSVLGRVYKRRNDLSQAEMSYRSALGIYRETWGESLGLARTLYNLGRIAGYRGQLDVAAERYQQALQIRQKLAPESLDVAVSLTSLGIVATKRGQLDEAARYHRRALEIRKKRIQGGLEVASSLNNLGIIAWKRGQLDVAVEYHQQALEIRKELAPESLDMAGSLNNLGIVSYDRGQLDEAAEYYERTLQIREKLAPGSLDVASILNNLGIVATSRGRLDEAAQYHQRALEIGQKLAPKSLEVATSLNHLGTVAWSRGRLDEAAEYHQRALQIWSKLAPDNLDAADGLHRLGIVAWERGQLDEAAGYYRRALQIRQKLAPGSLAVATSLNHLGLVAWKQGKLDEAEDDFDRSLLALNAQIGKLGGSRWVQGGFRAQHRKLYRDPLELLLERNRPEQAFALLERSRARSFLAMLEERELIFSDIPEELDRQRRSLAVRHDRILQKMAALSATGDPEKVETLQGELDSLYRERDELRAKIRKESPNLANLQEPQPLAFAEVQEILDPGTVMLSYSVGEERTDLFVVAPGQDLTVYTLDVGEAELQEEVRYFREAIEAAPSDDFLGNLRGEDAEKSGRLLYEWLVEPAQDVVEAGDRVVLVPDGPLHRLPFAALIRKAGDEKQYLAEWKPLHSVLSATVYAEIRESRRAAPQDGGGPLLAVFGDPDYSPLGGSGGGEATDVQVRSARDHCGFAVGRLPASRREALGIADLYRNVRTYLGQGAREESVKSLGGDERIVHIAAHGCLDDRFPLNSGLFLTLPDGLPDGRDNGLLQAWEIFESVRLDADLVVLSACESGLGQEQGGEGLIGLTRAFQYAGARTVAASLWQVDDQVTAELMVRFYRHLRSGKTKDAALRAAQVELIRGPIEVRGEDGRVREIDASAPYYWAAFQLTGDWR